METPKIVKHTFACVERGTKKMKRLWAIILVIAIVLVFLVLPLSACENKEAKKTGFDIDEELRGEVQTAVMAQCAIQYQGVRYTTVNITDIRNDDDTYTVKGKAVVTDDYGDEYTGKFIAVYEYRELSNGSPYFWQESLDIETPTRSVTN